MKSSKSGRKRHVSHDGSVREYDYKTNEWILIEQDNDDDNDNDDGSNKKKPLALEGRLFDIIEYFPYLYNKKIMDFASLNKFDGKFKINGNSLYIGNMINNGLKSRESLDQQHGDTGNNLWDTSILFAKCLEYNTFNNNDDGINKILNVSNKNILELGTGTGFVGLTAIYCNANNVWLTDLKYCMQNIQININKNRFIWNLNNNDKQCEIKQCDVDNDNDNDDDDDIINPFYNVSVFELDWINYKQSLLKYDKIKKNSIDLIIGSDIIWIKELVPFLVNTLQYLYENILDKKNGFIVIGEQIRSNVISELFWNLMESKGFYRNNVPIKLYHPHFISHKVFLSILSKRKQL